MSNYKILVAFLILFGITATVYAFRKLQLRNTSGHQSELAGAEEENFGLLLQDEPLAEFTKIMQNYEKDLDTRGTINLFKNSETSQPFEKTSFFVSKRSRDYFYRVDSVEIIHTGKLMLTVDHNAEMMLLDSSLEDMKSGLLSMDTIWKIMEAHETKTAVFYDKGMKLLRMENLGDPAVYAIRIYYRPDSYEISKIVYDIIQSPLSGTNIQYPDGAEEEADSLSVAPVIDTVGGRISITSSYEKYIMEVKYENWKRGKELTPGIPVITDYLEFNGDDTKIKGKYSGYQFLNAASQTKQE